MNSQVNQAGEISTGEASTNAKMQNWEILPKVSLNYENEENSEPEPQRMMPHRNKALSLEPLSFAQMKPSRRFIESDQASKLRSNNWTLASKPNPSQSGKEDSQVETYEDEDSGLPISKELCQQRKTFAFPSSSPLCKIGLASLLNTNSTPVLPNSRLLSLQTLSKTPALFPKPNPTIGSSRPVSPLPKTIPQRETTTTNTATVTRTSSHLLERGFLQFLKSGEFSDITLISNDGNSEYHAHRLILAHGSHYFYQLLRCPEYGYAASIPLPYPDQEGIFPEVLKFMYTSAIDINERNAIPLLAMADYYLMSDLKKLASEAIAATTSRNNALSTLERALKFNADEVVHTCNNVIAKHFCYIYDADYSFLEPKMFLELLHHPTLAVNDEWMLYNTICTFLKKQEEAGNTLSEQIIHEMMSAVRFRWMSRQELEKVVENPLVPQEFIIESLMAKLSVLEPGAPLDLNNVRLQKRKKFGITFQFSKEHDGIGGNATRGILYWISTNCGQGVWENAHVTGRVEVTASSIEKGAPLNLVSRSPTELWSKDIPASWFAIDLRNRSVIPTYYTCRHGGNYRADALRTWDLQGSNDGVNWVVLRRHRNDNSLNSSFATHSWPIESVTTPYRHFRILQTGHNSSNHNFLVCCGIELYGELFENSFNEGFEQR